jgi:TonB-linked SusC/RagA family outer membrane protein
MKQVLFSVLLLLGGIGMTYGQKMVSGKVTDSAGEPLIGASVTAKGTTVGTITDVDGSFALKVPAETNAVEVSYTGYDTQEFDVTNGGVIDVVLQEGKLLDEVVVTALGIKRDKKALGYATTNLGESDLARKGETDVARALAGRAPGVNIASSAGLAGSGTKINIRGTSTISGNSQPLWVVDGVPVNVSANEINADFRDGNVTPTRNLDIDPNNIASMSILKGLAASTLYGAAGRNGVILITTKTGSGASSKSKFNASVSQSYGTVKAFIPEYQDKWANGFDGDYGEFFSNWGVLFSNNSVQARHPYYEWRNLFPNNPEFAQPYTPQAFPNNVSDFFNTGQSLTTSINAGVNTEIGSFNVAFSRLGETGYIKNNDLNRLNFTVGGSSNIGSRLKLNANVAYIKTDFKTPPVAAGLGSNSDGGPSVFANLFYVPRNIDLTNLPNTDPVTGGPVFYRNNNSITNPYWLLDNAGQTSNVDRIMSNFSANYRLFDWLSATYRIGIDNYSESQDYYVNKGSVGYPAAVQAFASGYLRSTLGKNRILDQSFILNGNRTLSSDFDLTYNVGFNGRQDSYDQTGIASTGQIVFGLLSHRNFSASNQRDLRNSNMNYSSNQLLLGAFGDFTLGYRNYLYLNVQGRNDWSSAHEKDNRSLFYPGVSLSFVPTDAFEALQGGALDYLKLRVSRGTSANFASPYRTRPFLSINTQASQDALGNVVTLGYPELLANPLLRPELQTELEGGIEAKLFDNRIGIDLSFYNRDADDQIVERPLDPSTGYTSTFDNIGNINNKGIELGLTVTPVRTKNINWDLTANFTRNVSLVTLPEGTDRILISGYSNLGNFAETGQPYGVIYGRPVEKDASGNLLVNENGDWVIATEATVIGDPNPDYMLTGISQLTVHGITLGAQIDFVKGGDIFSYSAATPIGRGVAKELEDFNPELPVILPGVSKETGEVNNIPMPASGLFFGNTIIGGGADDRGIYDATRIRIREVSLSYSLPTSLLSKSSTFKGINFAIVGNNLWFRTFNTPASSKVDADRTAFGSSNGLGFDFLGGPSARRIAATVKFDF